MKIVVTVASLHGGGAEYVARTWMRWLADRGHQVHAVLTGRDADPDFIPTGVQVTSLAAIGGQSSKVRALRAIFVETRPDVVLSLQMHSNLTAISAARLIPSHLRPKVVISERNLVSLGLAQASWRHRLKVRVAKRQYRRADGVIAISHPVAGELVAGFGVRGDRLFVVPNPATAKVERKVAGPPVLAEGEGIDRLRILLPCRLVSQKRPQLALRVAAELERRGRRVDVVSFGNGPLLAEMQRLATELDVRFDHRGWVEDWYARNEIPTVVLLPSDREGFGNVLVEAAAAGLPSVAVSGALGVADALVPGISGELALTADPSDLADAVIDALNIDLESAAPWLKRFSVENSGALLERTLTRLSPSRP